MNFNATKTGIAFVGCGYVADLYVNTLENWRHLLDLRGVYDRSAKRLETFSRHYGLRAYQSYEELLADEDVTIVINLTNPDQHETVSRQALLSGRHVYSEKPLALDLKEAQDLIELAQERGLHIVSAPASVLGEAAQTLMKAVREMTRGQPRLVYAEMDDGLVHRMGYENWRTGSSAQWPATDEFQTGCTLEHAGYALTWLVAMFGPVRRMASMAKLLIPAKGPHTPAPYSTPDFSCACLEFDGGIVARLTNSIVAPHDHRFRVFCEDGILEVEETWDFKSPVRSIPVADTRLRRVAKKTIGWDDGSRLPFVANRKIASSRRGFPMDFTLGIAEMAHAISRGQVPRLDGVFSLHITEVSLAIQHPERFGTEYVPTSAPSTVAPMDWELLQDA